MHACNEESNFKGNVSISKLFCEHVFRFDIFLQKYKYSNADECLSEPSNRWLEIAIFGHLSYVSFVIDKLFEVSVLMHRSECWTDEEEIVYPFA